MNILLLDIESAPNQVYVWDLWGQDIHTDSIIKPGYTLCWSAKWLGKKEVFFGSLRDSTPAEMFGAIFALIQKADAVVTYNGNKYDMPILNREFVTQGLNPPSPYSSVDLYQTVKRVFKFQSNKLDYVCQRLGLGTKVTHKGMQLWQGCMAGDVQSWAIMERYNKRDVRLLERLYYRLRPWIINHPNLGVADYDAKHLRCTRCRSTRVHQDGYYYTKTGVYHQYECQSCGKWLRGRSTVRPPERKSPLLVDARIS